VLKLLDAASGVAGAPNALQQVAAAVAVVGYILIVVLVVLPTSRRALTTADQPSSRVR
jgi:preprotein translocase subunit SecG